MPVLYPPDPSMASIDRCHRQMMKINFFRIRLVWPLIAICKICITSPKIGIGGSPSSSIRFLAISSSLGNLGSKEEDWKKKYLVEPKRTVPHFKVLIYFILQKLHMVFFELMTSVWQINIQSQVSEGV